MGDERPGGAWDSSKSFPARSSPPVVSGNEEGQAGKLGECTIPRHPTTVDEVVDANLN